MDNKNRLPQHQRNENLESILKEINNLLYPIEEEVLESCNSPEYPVIFIMGAARSGTTLLLQWLADSGYFAYPTNLLSRFYKTPYLGAKIQLMLTKYDYNNEISKSFKGKVNYKSELGKTEGALAPNEFWYFWRRFFKFDEVHKLSYTDLAKINNQKFISELAAIEKAFGKPLVMKGMIANWHIPFLENILKKVLFIHVKRKPLFQIQSLLQARKKYYGDIYSWYSFKPPEYKFLKDKNPYEQIAGQIYYTNQAIKKGFREISENKCMALQYKEFCQTPDKYFNIIKDKLEKQGMNFNREYNGPDGFDSTNKIKLKNEEIDKINKAYKKVVINKERRISGESK